jgi:hypothetical protein
MTTFIALCRGRSINDSRLLALSTDPNILQAFARLLLGESCLLPSANNPKSPKRSPKNLRAGETNTK